MQGQHHAGEQHFAQWKERQGLRHGGHYMMCPPPKLS
jgi:hypothetical protein